MNTKNKDIIQNKIEKIKKRKNKIFFKGIKTYDYFDFNEVEQILSSDMLKNFDFVNVIGLMGMASFSNNEIVIENEFVNLNSIYNRFKAKHSFKVLSMGMSSDYEIAIKNGSNMLRLGSVIFGSRN